MKRKYFSALLMGALSVATMSTVTSCKDYDDDINSLRQDVDALSTFKTVKTELETKIGDLKTQLEAADGQLTEAINKKADATELEKLAARVTTLETQIKQATEARENLTSLIAGKVDQSDFDTEVKKLYAKIASVNSDLADKLSGIKEVKDGLDNEKTAREAADEDLQSQIEALKKFEDRIKALENSTATDNKIKELNDKLQNLQDNIGDTKISDLKKELKTISDEINNFQKEINVLNVLLDQRLRSLVFIPDSYYWGIEAQSFKYLEAKSWTLEATDYSKKERGYKYGTGATDDQVKDDDLATAGKRADHGHGLYTSSDYTSVMELWAKYHLNPSDVKADAFKSVSVLDADKNYINTRASEAELSSEAVLSVKKDANGKGIYNVKDGILSVQLDVKNPEKIKDVPSKKAVTVFATQVHLNNNTKESVDTVITSDYATLYADKYKDIRLSHTLKGYHWDAEPYLDKNGNPVKDKNGKVVTIAAHNSFDATTGQHNTHCGACSIEKKDGLHLMSTVHEATTLAAQDVCNWNQTLDLRQLVETHWTNTEGEHESVPSAKMALYGLTYKFELTGYYKGANNTDESAHAAINPEDGYTFRPQMAEEGTGKQQAYGAEQNLQTVGRTPVVRVSLIDKYGKVLDYGYIRIEITRSETAKEYNYKEVDFTNGTNNSYADACAIDFKGYTVYQSKWIQTEYEIYNLLGMSREDFEEYYGEEPVLYDNNEVAQYQKDANGKYVQIAKDNTLGTVVNIPDMDDETHTQTSTLKWLISGYKEGSTANKLLKDLYDKWVTETNRKTEKTYTVEIAVKYSRKNETVDATIAPDVYVKFKTQITFKPMTQWAATINWGSNKLSDYWYNTNTEVTGGTKDEIHVNVITPEDAAAGATAKPLDNLLSDNFFGNDVVKTSMLTSTQAGFNAGEWKFSLVFDKSNVGKKFKGNDDQTYVLEIADNGKTLNAHIDGKNYVEAIAKLVVPAEKVGQIDEADHTTIVYQETAYAKALLNYASRYDYKNANAATLNNTLTAIVGVVGENGCQTLNLSNNTFNVRFIRPINVKNVNKSIEDASTTGLQTIKLLDLVEFTDWRNAWKGVNPGGEYYTYYGITGVKIAGVNDGEVISQNAEVKANINKDGMKSLASQTKQLDFTYSSANGGTLTYRNLSSTVNTFEVEIPITVSYLWGDIYTTATVTVNKTAGAKKH